MFFLVYQTTNRITGQFYIGCHIAKNPDDNYLGSGKWLKRAIKKYGRGNFVRRNFAICASEKNMLELERLFVSRALQTTNCYNLVEGGGKPPAHYGDSNPSRRPEVIAKIRQAMIGRVFDEEWRRKIGLTSKGRVLSAEARAKISAANKGRPKSAEHKAKIGEGRRKAYASG
jgi:NUMOD3 motif